MGWCKWGGLPGLSQAHARSTKEEVRGQTNDAAEGALERRTHAYPSPHTSSRATAATTHPTPRLLRTPPPPIPVCSCRTEISCTSTFAVPTPCRPCPAAAQGRAAGGAGQAAAPRPHRLGGRAAGGGGPRRGRTHRLQVGFGQFYTCPSYCIAVGRQCALVLLCTVRKQAGPDRARRMSNRRLLLRSRNGPWPGPPA